MVENGDGGDPPAENDDRLPQVPSKEEIRSDSLKKSIDILDLKRKGLIKMRRVSLAFIGLAAANCAALILFSNNNNELQASGLQFAASVKVFCIYIWVTCGLSAALLILYFLLPIRSESDITSGVAGCIAALALICYMPVIGGYDNSSGIAFTDKPKDQQGDLSNMVRYDNIVSASNALFGFAVSYLLIAQTNIFIGVLNGIA